MPRFISSFAVLCALVLALVPRSSIASPPQHGSKLVDVLVQLKGEPLAADTNLKARSSSPLHRYKLDPALLASRLYSGALATYQNREISYLRQQGISLSPGRQLHVVFNGFSTRVPADQLPALRHLSNVVAVFPERHFHLQLDRSLPLVHAEQAWQQLGGGQNAGKGMMIADIDSGIDISNPCFSDAGFTPSPIGRRADTAENQPLTNNKVIVARAFGPDPTKHYSAADHSGHGTFTAAIEGCDYNTLTPLGTRISGMAPAAYLMNYNVFPESGNSSDSAILGGIEAALLDGADVMNLSLGSSGGAGDLRLDPDSTAVSLAIKAGVSVVISAGNAGPTADTVSSPAAAPDAIAVGAATNSRALYSSISVNGPGSVPAALGKIEAVEGSYAWTGTIGPASIVYVGYGRSPGDDPKAPKLDEFAGKDLHGKIALIQRGSDTGSPIFFETKVSNAAKAGAIAAIVFDNRTEAQLMSIDVGKAQVRTMFISQADGQGLLAWIQAHPDAQVTMNSSVTPTDETPDVLTDFSSRGPSAGYIIKPDIIAPGQDIYSATQKEYSQGDLYNPNGFVSADGTSFSGPHVTGAVALVFQKHPKWTPAMVKSVLMDTASSSVSLGEGTQGQPSVMEVGAGLLDINAALSATAYLTPPSLTFGQLNVGAGGVQQDGKLTLNDVGGGSGSWQISLDQLQSGAGLTLTVPPSVTLPANGTIDVPVHLTAAASTGPGDYDGYVVLQRNGETLRAPYFVHINNEVVKPGSVLLVDNSTSLFQPQAPFPAIQHLDVSRWYEQALTAIGKSYTYWNEAALGTPSLADMRRASAVIYFTGTNLNGFAPQNTNVEALDPPMGSDDVTTLHSYMDSGGKLFVTGMGAALSDPYWMGIVLGAETEGYSVFDNANNDTAKAGGISPPRPSALPDTGAGPLKHAGIFAGLKGIDISTKGDGAHDNLAIYNLYLTIADSSFSGLIGVPGMTPFSGNAGFQGNAYGQSVLKTARPALTDGGTSLGIVSSDEPSFSHRATYPGRSVLFSFGFEGINDNTGYATRTQVLQRIFQWFADHPVASVTTRQVHAGQRIQLQARLRGPVGAAQYIWQVGGKRLAPTASAPSFRFPHTGTYQVRVQITDKLGHVAVTPWTTVRAR